MSDLNNISKGEGFENEVKKTLILQGKNVLSEKLLGSKKVDLFFLQQSFSKTYRYAVECKNYEKKLSKSNLISIITDYSALFESNLIDKLLIVTNKGLSPASIEFLNLKNNIEHITLDELINSTIDFSLYVNQIITDYEHSNDGLNEYYIDLNVKEDIINYNELNNITSIVNKWIESEDNKPVAILASYGQGKTSFSRKLSYDLARNYLGDHKKRLPIFVRLSSISKEQSIEGLLGKLFTTTALVKNYNFHSFDQMNKLGKFVIILDGFDEMKHSLNWEEFKYNFGQLNRLVTLNSKVILLGRPNAFLNDDEHFYALKGIRKTKLGVLKDPNWPEYYELEIEPLNSSQIELFLDKYYSYRISNTNDTRERNILIHAKEFKSKNISDKRIREISNRPVQLKMLADILPYVTLSIEDITTTYLYDEFINQILDREYEKESKLHISKDNRRKFSRQIAMFLWENSSEYSINYEDIPEQFFIQFIPSNSKEVDKIKRDLISGCFLSRKLGSSIYFSHRSFQEFFVAEEILNRFSKDKKVDLNYINSIVTLEVGNFLAGLSGLKELSNIDYTLKDYQGNLSLNFLEIFIQNENKDYIYNKIHSSYSPWYALIFVLINSKSIDTNFLINGFKNYLLDTIDSKKINDYRKILFSIFLSLHETINCGEYVIEKLCEILVEEINKSNIENKKRGKKSIIPSNINKLTDLIIKINISKRNTSIDVRGLFQIFVKELDQWCFVSEWIKDKTVNINEYRIAHQIHISSPSIFIMINKTKNQIEQILSLKSKH